MGILIKYATRYYVVLPIFVFFASLSSCKTKYIAVESVRTEYRNEYLRDSVYLHDSIVTRIKGDTVWLEKYKYLYKDKLLRDSIFVNDTIRIPYPVIETIEVNRIKGWQNFLMWSGGIVLFVMACYLGFRFVRQKLF